VRTYGWELIANEDIVADALTNDAAGEDEVVESERSSHVPAIAVRAVSGCLQLERMGRHNGKIGPGHDS
jgi:hypothetical protein